MSTELSPDNRCCLFCPHHDLGWHYQDVGHGRPLILLHGIGMSHVAWKNVIHKLANKRRVLAFDIAGFGMTPVVPDGVEPTPANLVSGIGSLAETIERIDAERQMSRDYECLDIVGNSLGGYVALEAAKLGKLGGFRINAIVAISPAGLWKKRYPLWSGAVLELTRLGVTHLPGLIRILLRQQYTRKLIMAIPASSNVPEEDAYELQNIFASAPVFVSKVAFKKFRASMKDAFTGGRTISQNTRVTIAFGKRDWLLPPRARLRQEIPEVVNWQNPPGWGHVPMWDDAEGVTKLILESTS